jgi:hypothetical protein
MILSFQEIEAALNLGLIRIEPPPDKSLWTSTALDLTLNNVLKEWIPPKEPPSGGKIP